VRIDPKKLSEITRKTVEAARSEQVDGVGATTKSSQAAQADQVNLSHQAQQIQRAHQARPGHSGDRRRSNSPPDNCRWHLIPSRFRSN